MGVLIDDGISWNYHISYTCSRISRNTGIFLKLRHFLPLEQLAQLYYNLIYPYLSYAIIGWGSASASQLKKIQVKQNHILSLMLFATLYGKNTDSSPPLMNLLDILTVENIFILLLLQFSHQWHKKQLPRISFDSYFRYAMFIHSILDMLQKAISIKHVSGLILEKQRCRLWQLIKWQKLPHDIKELNPFIFPQKTKQYLLRKQL